jgi:hypothetical protein
MKRKGSITGLFVVTFILLVIPACTTQKDVAQRRSLMIPKKSEMPRNSRYKEVTHKPNKFTLIKSKKKSLF